ncbi:unnamed protein product [Rotaria sp. Silwood1]|nr:unnamed protein product [Rotaria sp. Silwood1]
MTISIIRKNETGPSKDLNQLEPSFMYTQIFKEILLDVDYGQQAIQDLTEHCRKLNKDDNEEKQVIAEFESTYEPSKAIWWYTRECFTYKMLNRALRTLDGDIIIRMGFFLRDVHQQIEDLHKKQATIYKDKSFTVYRGQGLSTADFEKLKNNEGGLISFSNFLSTSTDRETSLEFANHASTIKDMVGIVFQMTIDRTISSTPFAKIREESYFNEEEETLFSMHTVFRIDKVRKINEKSSLYQVDLTLTSDDDQELRDLTDYIRGEVKGEGWYRLGDLLLTIGQPNKAEELYISLIEQASEDTDKACIYAQLGWVKDDQGQYERAITYYTKAIKIKEQNSSEDELDLSPYYNNIAMVYDNMGEYSKALEFYEKSLKIKEKALPPNHPSLADSYNNISQVYKNMGDYSKALEFSEKALKIREEALPPNHPSLATSYNNIAIVYDNLGNYSKALEFYEKSHQILEKALPPNHPNLASSYNNIAIVHVNMGEYSKALKLFEKGLKIDEKNLPPNHSDLAPPYNNIGAVYYTMKDYLKALEFYEKSLHIREKTLPPNHPDIAQSYNNIGMSYSGKSDHSQALSFLEKALAIRQKSLPSTHPLIEETKDNIDYVKKKM